jgi:uncharacterized protein (DUF362 family)
MVDNSKIPVALARCEDYEAPDLEETVERLLETIGCRPSRGADVLVKPNLLAPTPPDFLPCTHPTVVRAVCRYLLDLGGKVRVGDSPTFGKGVEIAGKIGLAEALSDLPVELVNLDNPRVVRLSFGGRTALSRQALDSDLIVSVSKLKAHHQVRVTGAVKNFYGCVTGLRKPILHLLYGDRDGRFERMMLEIPRHLPPTVSLMDAVTVMHVRGPNNGEPFDLGMLAASQSPVALDSAAMSILCVKPEDAPLWRMSLELDLPGARLEDLEYPLDHPEAFDGKDFKSPETLFPMSFRPLKVAVHMAKRLRAE